MKVLFITNIPVPYRIEFFEKLGMYVDLTVIFEAKSVEGITFNYNYDFKNFKGVFLSNDNIKEKSFDFKILKYIKKDYDYIYATNYSCFTELLAIVKMKIFKIPYILEIDGVILHEESKLKKAFKKYIINGATEYFSPSKLSDQYLQQYIGMDKKIIRYPFTSLNKNDVLLNQKTHHNRIKEELNVGNKKVILYVGQFIKMHRN